MTAAAAYHFPHDSKLVRAMSQISALQAPVPDLTGFSLLRWQWVVDFGRQIGRVIPQAKQPLTPRCEMNQLPIRIPLVDVPHQAQ